MDVTSAPHAARVLENSHL